MSEEPRVELLDARSRGLGESGLREWARSLGATSRSYRFPYALVAWHPREVGVDIERVERCDEAFAELICTPSELADPRRHEDRDRFLTRIWSGKEALSKALGDALDHEPARLESPLMWPGGSAGRWRARALDLPHGYVGWVCWRAIGS